jgi:phenylalanyl-tRNA synthetase beta chain
MKISLNHIRPYQDQYKWSGDLAPDGIEALVDRIGSQLGAVEGVTDIGKMYEGVLIAKIVACQKLEESDHLSVCMIDDGGVSQNSERDEDGHVQVVCGAPNVREGLTVVWLPPGTIVPESFAKEPFVLEARIFRGHKSNGMLASPRELGIGENHEGILEIDEDVTPGTLFAKTYGLSGDYVIDIENKMFTHRPDCFGMIGVARELAGIQNQAFKSPDWYESTATFPSIEADSLKLAVKNELPELVKRFTAITMSSIEVKPSPVWLQVQLSRLGIRPINNVVDLTNYYMVLTGQPLHAYDYDKVAALSGSDGAVIEVRNPKAHEKIKLLNGKEIEPRSEAIMIGTPSSLIGLGGVMGGSETEVDENTKNIIIEAATFDMYSVRRTAMVHGLFTDAVTRFSKGQSPLQNVAVLAKVADDMRQYAGGKVAGQLIDDNHLSSEIMERNSVDATVSISRDFVNSRLGLKLSTEDMAKLLTNVEFHVTQNDNVLAITAPFWRTDIEIPEDIVEEVGRLYGYDKLPLELPLRSIAPAEKNQLLELKGKVRAILAKAGANEILTYSFVHGNLLEKAGQEKSQAFQISNALSPDLQYYRLSLTPSLLANVHPNIKAGYDEFVLFEIGKGHNLMHKDSDEGLPAEFEMLDVIYAAKEKPTSSGAAFYKARKYLDNLAAGLGLELEYRPFTIEDDYPVAKPYDPTRSAQIFVKGTDLPLGMIGEYKQSVRKSLKLPEHCAGFSIGLVQLHGACKQAPAAYVPLPRFPKVEQDVTLKLPVTVPYQKLEELVLQHINEMKPEQTVASTLPLGIYQRSADDTYKQVTFRLSIASYQRTLTDSEVHTMLDRLTHLVENTIGSSSTSD